MRLNIELPKEQVSELQALMKTIGVDTYKDLFNNALTLLQWAVDEVKNSRKIASVDEAANKYRELAMPAFDNARRAAQREKPAEREVVSSR